jgi:hypothetical protein
VVAWHSNMECAVRLQRVRKLIGHSVDCDGAPKTGACANDDAHQGMTAFTCAPATSCRL